MQHGEPVPVSEGKLPTCSTNEVSKNSAASRTRRDTGFKIFSCFNCTFSPVFPV